MRNERWALKLDWSEKPKKISSELASEAKLAVIGSADKQAWNFKISFATQTDTSFGVIFDKIEISPVQYLNEFITSYVAAFF